MIEKRWSRGVIFWAVFVAYSFAYFLAWGDSQIGIGTAVDRQKLYVTTPPRNFPAHTVLTNLQAGHGWSKQSAQGTQSDDTSDYVKGVQSLSLVTDGIGSAVFTRKSSISPAVDLTGKYIKVWVKVSDTSLVSELWFYASSDNFAANFYTWKISDDISQMKSGVWTVVTLSMGEATVSGAPNRAAINALQFRVKDTASAAVTAKLGGVAAVAEPSACIVSITFDDNRVSQFTEGKKKLDEYGYAATIYAIPSLVGSSASYLTLAQLKELQDKHGWDIASHTYNHVNLTTLNSANVENELILAKAWLLDNGLTKGADHFSYPNGGFDETTIIPIVKKYYRTARTIANYTETMPPADYYRLRVLLVTNTTPLGTLTAATTQCKNNKEWLIPVFHNLVASPSASTEFSIANFGSYVDDLASQGVTVLPISDAIINN